MSEISGIHNDICISYSEFDDASLFGEGGWIASLRNVLGVRLAQLVGRKVTFAADAPLAGNEYSADEAVKHVRDSAILICVVSPRYVRSATCLREVEEFLSHAKQTLPTETEGESRVFKVVKTGVLDSDQPEPLRDILGYQFYAYDPATGVREFKNHAGRDDSEFWHRVNDLAHDIADRLRSIERGTSDGAQPRRLPHPLDVISANKPVRRLQVFLCHSSDDKSKVRSLYKFLASAGANAWLDEEKLLPGQLWEQEIPRAVRASDAVVVCLSRFSISKMGYVQKEIRAALDVADEHPEGALYLIPVKLEECTIPERLAQRHWVNLFQDHGDDLLLKALQARATQLCAQCESNG